MQVFIPYVSLEYGCVWVVRCVGVECSVNELPSGDDRHGDRPPVLEADPYEVTPGVRVGEGTPTSASSH